MPTLSERGRLPLPMLHVRSISAVTLHHGRKASSVPETGNEANTRHFTPASLTLALERAGFAIARVSHFQLEQNPYGWLQTAFNRAGGRWGALYYQIRARGSAHAQPPRPIVIAAATALMPACVALATIESMLGAGGAIEVWARPRPFV